MICTKSNVLLLMINGKKEFRKACKDDSRWLTELKRQKIKKANITFAAHCHKVNVLQKGVFYFHYIHDTVILNLLCFLFFFFFLFHRPCRGREPCHQLGQGKSGRQRGTATDKMDKRGNLDQEDIHVHESGCRILPTQPHMGPGDFQVTCSIEL